MEKHIMDKQRQTQPLTSSLRASIPLMQTWRRLICCLIVCAIFVTNAKIALTQEEGALINREYPLKAIFLYNFAGYIEWPAGTFANEQTPFVFGVFGSAQIEDTLKEIATKKKIGERKIECKKFATTKDIKQCQILFVPRDVTPQQRKEILEVLKNEHVLVVGESAGFANEGASINFFIEANKIRFEINTDVTKRLNLKVSSKLLSMAKITSGDSSK